MTNQEIFDLVACFDRSTAQTMKLSTQEFTIELTRAARPLPRPRHLPPRPPRLPSRPACPWAGPSIDAPPTFYTSPAPDQAPFVLPGTGLSNRPSA